MMTLEAANNLKSELKSIGNIQGEKADCAVRALAAVSGLGYDYVNRWLITRGYRKPRSGTHGRPYQEFLTEHGIESEVLYNTSLGMTMQEQNLAFRRSGAKTIRTFQRVKSRGKYLVLVRRHVLAVIDGHAIDWADNRQLRLAMVIQVK